jgi:tellurite resistance protein
VQAKIETAAEACAALAVLIASADELGTNEERGFLFETVKAMPLFADLDQKQFKKLIADTTAGLYTPDAMQGNRLASAEVGRLVDMIRDALPADRRVEALEVAVDLARTDGVVSVEALLLQRLCEGLEIEPEATRRLLGRLA